MTYFSKLNYTMANEDTSVEYACLPSHQDQVVAVAGSGSRVLPLLAKKPKKLCAVDLVPEQIFLCEGRVQALRQLSYDQYLKLWGYESATSEERQDLFHQLDLSTEAKSFLEAFFREINYQSPLFQGKFERFILLHHRIVRTMMGRFEGLFKCKTIEEQRAFFQDSFPWRRFRAYLRLFGNEAFYNLVLYKGHFPKKNISQSFFDFYFGIYNRLFQDHFFADNFYLQMILGGGLSTEGGRPIEARKDIFAAAKEGALTTDVSYVTANILEYAAKRKADVDFLSFSNVPSYFTGKVEQNFYQIVKPGMNQGGRIVTRAYSHIPFRPDTRGFENITSQFDDALSEDSLPMYFIDIHQKL